MKENFFNKKIEYFWEYDYAFGEFFLKEIFGDRYKRKYSMDGTGIYNLIYGEDGKIYDLKLTQAKQMIAADENLSRNIYQNIMVKMITDKLDNYSVSKCKYVTFPLGATIAKIEITKKMKEPV